MRRRGRSESIQAVEALIGRAIPPNFSERLKLKEAAEGWKGIVGAALAARSVPADVADGELLIVADTPLAANRLSMMGGNIVKALAERLNFSVVKRVRVVVGAVRPLQSGATLAAAGRKTFLAGSAASAPRPKVAEVKDLARRCLELSPDLPEDAAESFAELRLFFEKRFQTRIKQGQPRNDTQALS
jgi:hypothetical protein